MLIHGCLSAGNYTIKGLTSTPVYSVVPVCSGYGVFVVVILFNTCQCQCYTSTHIQISTVSLADTCELPEENNAVQLAPVRLATALSVSHTVSPTGCQVQVTCDVVP